MKKLWKCKKCKRIFEKKNQPHSCNLCPIEEHFKNKEKMKPLFNEFKETARKKIGNFRIESLPCCIHLVKNPVYAFACVYILKDRIRVSFSLNYKIKSSRITKFAKIFGSYKYLIDFKGEREIDKELLDWIKQAYQHPK